MRVEFLSNCKTSSTDRIVAKKVYEHLSILECTNHY